MVSSQHGVVVDSCGGIARKVRASGFSLVSGGLVWVTLEVWG